MTAEEKQLLFIDICARLPYGVKCRQHKLDSQICTMYPEYLKNIEDVEKYEPYLRSLSSITKKEKKELLLATAGKKSAKYFQVLSDGSIASTDAKVQDLYNFVMHWINFDKDTTTSYIDWLNKHHFDYRGLIEKGLALEAPTNMYNN